MLKIDTSRWLVLALLATSVWSYGQSFVPTSDNLVPVYGGPMEWADLDGDGDLDIIYSGFTDDLPGYATKVYENVNGSFIAKTTALPNVRNGGFALGDYDKDGDLDVLLGGLSASGYISDLYENKGAFSFSLKASYAGLINTAFTWFDIDNDEDLDFLFAGVDDHTGGPDPFVNKIFVYENTGNAFSLLTTTMLPGTSQNSMDWADSNGDGKIDLLVMGLGDNFQAGTTLYLNDGNKKFTQDTRSTLKQTYNGDVKWGDFDNDGDMDVLLAGIQTDGTAITVVYENVDGVLKERTDIPLPPLGETWFGGSKWVDYNNDGLLDILVSGRGESVLVVKYVFELYQNKGNGTFEKVQEPFFMGLSDSSVDFGDFDNDGDADICFTGISPNGLKAGIYENRILDGPAVTNSKPSPPSLTGFSERFFRKKITLIWQDGSDQQTPAAGLSYNFYLRNSVTKITSPTSNFTTGYLLTTNPANGHAKRSIVNDIPEGSNYYWAVQSIDGAASGSLFSGESTFYQINGPEAKKAVIINPTSVKLTWVDNSSIETSYQVVRSVSPTTGFTSPVALAQNTVSYTDNFAFLTETYYYYRIYAANATKASGYDSLQVLIPSAPTGLLAQSVNASQISLTWNDNSAYESGYEVERKLSSGGSFAKVATLAANAKSYTDTGLSEGTSYDYRVRAVIAYGTSVYSNISKAKTNFRPLGNNFARETSEDGDAISFAGQEFVNAFSDPDPSDELVAIVIATLPQNGILKLNNNTVTTQQIIPLAALDNLQFIPNPNENGLTSLTFFNTDGKDNSLNTYAVALNIIPVNDPPDFSIPATTKVNEDFTAQVKIRPQPGSIPQDELSQVVTYSIQPETSDIVSMSFNPATGELILSSMPDKFGEIEFTITATDGQAENNAVSKALKFTIEPVNDAPTLSAISNQIIEYGNTIPVINFTVADVDDPIASIVLSVLSDNQALVKNNKIIVQGATAERSIQISPEEHRTGDASITLSASDGVATTTIAFNVNIFSITAIPESMGRAVKVYPNPFTSSLHVNVEGSYERAHKLVLYDPLGREISSILLTESESTVNFEQVRDGVYLLNIIGANGDILFRERVVKN